MENKHYETLFLIMFFVILSPVPFYDHSLCALSGAALFPLSVMTFSKIVRHRRKKNMLQKNPEL
ncbi:MAG: hypothetical protein JWL92_4 [Candidatus Nomurabacteria bacterium]|nr:hypothetical protein [Candidatus Nomurabacteria bacterium]